jgi:hypothetical protein
VASERVLIAGCGPHRWARALSGPLGMQLEKGWFGAHTVLSAQGTQHAQHSGIPGPAEARVSLSGLIEREACWLPADTYAGTPTLSVLPAQGQLDMVPRVPSVAGLARAAASWASVQLGGAGTLVVPKSWNSDRARGVLHGYAQAGWSLSSLEPLLSAPRVLSQNGLFLRLSDDEGDIVLPVDAHVARALSTLRSVYKQVLSAAGPVLSARWLEEEEDRQGWFARTQILWRLTEGLRAGLSEIDLGGAHAPIFGRSGSTDVQALAPLFGLRIRVRFPAADTSKWLEKASWPGFLRSRSGRIRVRGLEWTTEPMAVLSTPGVDAGWQAELRALGVELKQVTLDEGLSRLAPEESFSQRFPGFVPAAMRGPAKLVGAEIVGPEVGLESTPGPPVQTPDVAKDAPVGPPEDPVPGQEDALPAPVVQRPFHPQRIELTAAHRAGSLRVFVEGEHQEHAELNPLGGAAGPRLYEIDGVAIAHGALLRVDFEPEKESP